MTQKKVLRYHLKKDVRYDLQNLMTKISYLMYFDSKDGFASIPSYSILPALFKVYFHLLWNRTFESWFKKIYV